MVRIVDVVFACSLLSEYTEQTTVDSMRPKDTSATQLCVAGDMSLALLFVFFCN